MADPSKVANSQPNPLSKKLSRILDSKIETDKDTTEALRVLSEFMGENSLQARRNLRSNLERRGLSFSQDFRDLLGDLATHVNLLQDEVKEMRECCQDMQQRLLETKTKTAGLLQETAGLKARGSQLEMRNVVVQAFLKRFQLDKEDLEVLVGQSHKELSNDFFSVLGRVKSIHEDCKLLLRSSQQRAGLEIMEQMAMHLEEGYERLYHWTQSQCRAMTGDAPPSSATLRRALVELGDRPILHKYCMDEYVLARRGALVQAFISALTKSSGSSRPIELVSHDPVRYVGDMFSWLHQAIATEKDHITGLFGENGVEATSLLSSITEGASRPLKMRVEQVLLTTGDPVVAYRLVNLVRYYLGVFRVLLGMSAPLLATATELSDLQAKLFFSSLTIRTSRLLELVDVPEADLSPPQTLTGLLSMLQEVLSARDISVCSLEDHQQDLKKMLNACIDPVIQYCNESASSLLSPDMAVFLINCLYLVHSTISLYEYTEPALEKLHGQILAHTDTLVDHQASECLAVSGLAQYHKLIQEGGTILRTQLEEIHTVARARLAQFLSAPDSVHLPQLKGLTSSKFREDILHRSLQLFVAAYKQIYQHLMEEFGNAAAESALPHSPEQAAQLLA